MTMNLTLAVSFFPAPAKTSTRSTRREMLWTDLAQLLSVHERRLVKNGRGWSPATYTPGTTRANRNVVAISAFVGDVDHATDLDYHAIRERLSTLHVAFTIYSTFQNCPPDDFRFRIVIPFLAPVRSDEGTGALLGLWRSIWQRATDHLLLGRNDPNTKDLSRFFFLPAAPPEVAVFAESHAGEPLDWEDLPAAGARLNSAVDALAAATARADLSYRTLEFLALGAPVGHQRERALAAVRALLASGRTVTEAAQLVWHGLEISPCGDLADPWTYDAALDLAADMASRPPTPQTTYPVLMVPAAERAEAGSPPNLLRSRARRLAASFRSGT
jgi:hypothetical protein